MSAVTPDEIEMQDIRLVCGDGDLSASDVLKAVNVILRQRKDAAERRAKRMAEITERLGDVYANPNPNGFLEFTGQLLGFPPYI